MGERNELEEVLHDAGGGAAGRTWLTRRPAYLWRSFARRFADHTGREKRQRAP